MRTDMEKWEYAAGECRFDEWVERSNPGTYENARNALTRLLAEEDPTSDYSMIDPRVVKRCDRYPEWQPVFDHTAELLAELTLEVAHEFRRVNHGVVQGSDLYAVFAKLSNQLNPRTENPQEFDA